MNPTSTLSDDPMLFIGDLSVLEIFPHTMLRKAQRELHALSDFAVQGTRLLHCVRVRQGFYDPVQMGLVWPEVDLSIDVDGAGRRNVLDHRCTCSRTRLVCHHQAMMLLKLMEGVRAGFPRSLHSAPPVITPRLDAGEAALQRNLESLTAVVRQRAGAKPAAKASVDAKGRPRCLVLVVHVPPDAQAAALNPVALGLCLHWAEAQTKGGYRIGPRAMVVNARIKPAAPADLDPATHIDLLHLFGGGDDDSNLAHIETEEENALAKRLMDRLPVLWPNDRMPLASSAARVMNVDWALHADGQWRLGLGLDSPVDVYVFGVNKRWYFDLKTRTFGPLEAPEQLLAWRATHPAVPNSALSRFRELAAEKGLLEMLPSFPDKTLAWDQRPRQMRPVVRLSLASARKTSLEPDASPAQAHAKACDLLLEFDYEGQRVGRSASFSAVAIDGDQSVRFERNSLQENNAAMILSALGLSEPLHWSGRYTRLHDQVLEADAAAALVPSLSRNGFVIEYADNFPVEVVDGEFQILADLEDAGGKWFTMTLGIEVDGKRYDLIPLLKAILARDDFSLKRPPSERDDEIIMVPLDERKRLPMPLERVRKLLTPLVDQVMSLGRSERALKLRKIQGNVLTELEEGSGLEWSSNEDLRQTLALMKSNRVEMPVPAGFMGEHRDYQIEGLHWLSFLEQCQLGGLLGDEMSLGKTTMVLMHLLSMKERGVLTKPALIVVPTQMVGHWIAKAQQFTPALRALELREGNRFELFDQIDSSDLVVTTYGTLINDIDHFRDRPLSLVVLDESKAISNVQALTSKVVRELKPDRMLGLNATPLENNYMEVFSQLDTVEPGVLGTRKQFVEHFCTPIEKYNDQEALARLRQRVAPLILAREKKGVDLPLPPVIEYVRPILLGQQQRDFYEAVRAATDKEVRELLARKGAAKSQIEILAAITRMRMICSDPRICNLPGSERFTSSAKMDDFAVLADEIVREGRRSVVFTEYLEIIELMKAVLQGRGYDFVEVVGSVKGTDRDRRVAGFTQGSQPFFLGTLRAAGHGLELQAANTVILYDQHWNPQKERQAIGRVHRQGVQGPVRVHRLIATGTIEERVEEVKSKKIGMANAFMGNGEGFRSKLSEKDILAMLAPLTPAGQ